jgi:hypothetical protein
MRLQDYTIDVTKEAKEEAFRYAKAVPEDKADWKPLDAGQSVLSMCRELAKCPDWAYELVSGEEANWSEEAQAAQKAEMEGWTSVEACERACEEKLGRYFELLKGLPDARFTETKDLPFGPGGSMKTFTMAEMMDYPRWNFTYHLGQIGYIQTLYGDKGLY